MESQEEQAQELSSAQHRLLDERERGRGEGGGRGQLPHGPQRGAPQPRLRLRDDKLKISFIN